MSTMNDILILALVLATATSLSFRYVGWLGSARVNATTVPEHLVKRLRVRHRCMWIVGVIPQLQAIVFYAECGLGVGICTIIVFAIVFGEIHDIEFAIEIWKSFGNDSADIYTIPTVPLLTVASSVAMWRYDEAAHCDLWGAIAFGVTLFGSAVLLIIHVLNLSTTPIPQTLPEISTKEP